MRATHGQDTSSVPVPAAQVQSLRLVVQGAGTSWQHKHLFLHVFGAPPPTASSSSSKPCPCLFLPSTASPCPPGPALPHHQTLRSLLKAAVPCQVLPFPSVGTVPTAGGSLMGSSTSPMLLGGGLVLLEGGHQIPPWTRVAHLVGKAPKGAEAGDAHVLVTGQSWLCQQPQQ